MFTDIIEPTKSNIEHVKSQYNQLLKRKQQAEKYLDDRMIPQDEKELHTVTYMIEIVGVLDNYINILKGWGMQAIDKQILEGFKE